MKGGQSKLKSKFRQLCLWNKEKVAKKEHPSNEVILPITPKSNNCTGLSMRRTRFEQEENMDVGTQFVIEEEIKCSKGRVRFEQEENIDVDHVAAIDEETKGGSNDKNENLQAKNILKAEVRRKLSTCESDRRRTWASSSRKLGVSVKTIGLLNVLREIEDICNFNDDPDPLLLFKTSSDAVMKIFMTEWKTVDKTIKLCIDHNSDTVVHNSVRSIMTQLDAVLVMEAWNKALAFRTMFSEALIMRWRLLVALRKERSEDSCHPFISMRVVDPETLEWKHKEAPNNGIPSKQISLTSLDSLERGCDPLAKCFCSRINDLSLIMTCVIDAAVRALCPHNQTVQREAYRPMMGSKDSDPRVSSIYLNVDSCETLVDYCELIAQYGIDNMYWIDFSEAFLWSFRTHAPYLEEHDIENLNLPKSDSSLAKFVSGMVVLPMMEAGLKLRSSMKSSVYKNGLVPFWGAIRIRNDESLCVTSMAERAYNRLFEKEPSMRDFFSENELQDTIEKLGSFLDNVIFNCSLVCEASCDLREFLNAEGQAYCSLHLPYHAHLLLMDEIAIELGKFAIEFDFGDLFVKQILDAFKKLYSIVITFIAKPSHITQQLKNEAYKFISQVAEELQWTSYQLNNRLMEINLQIEWTGTYRHSSEELEIGARLAWRNSAKCVGRIAWDTLIVRDCRDIKSPHAMMKEVKKHLNIATSSTNIQSVMTVFGPKSPGEAWGTRFWSSQFVRYACYELDNGKVLGDPANLVFTKYLIRKGLWTPPTKRSAFDVLPIVIKTPGCDQPFVSMLPDEFIFEVPIEHPTCASISDLNLKWTTIPVITNFNLTLGGIDYPCCPFNGWFLSTEIVRNLTERYDIYKSWAAAMNMDLNDRLLKEKVSMEVQTAVLYSFEKNGYTIVDPTSVSNSFATHRRRERSKGRECPGQWSWIGGLLGPTNSTWHTEMRDFYASPQYDYCCNPWDVTDISEASSNVEDDVKDEQTSDEFESAASIPRVVIAFGSQTGTSEDTAYAISKKLALLRPTVLTLNQIAGLHKVYSTNTTYLIMLISTFGKGKPPSNASEFFVQAIEDSVKSRQLKTAILAFGSTHYPDFCAAGEKLDVLIRSAGIQPFMNLVRVDAASNNSDHVIDRWFSLVKKEILPSRLEEALRKESDHISLTSNYPRLKLIWTSTKDSSNNDNILRSANVKIGQLTKINLKGILPPHELVICRTNNELTKSVDKSCNAVHHIELQLNDIVCGYETGDHLMVHPMNQSYMIRRFVACFSRIIDSTAMPTFALNLKEEFGISLIDGENMMPLSSSVLHSHTRTLAEVLQRNVDFSLSETLVVDVFSLMLTRFELDLDISIEEQAKSRYDELMDLLKSVVESSDKDKRKQTIKYVMSKYPTIVHLLEMYSSELQMMGPQPLISMADILMILPRLKPRYYSISSSSELSPNNVSLTVRVLRTYTSEGVLLNGVCSNYLAKLKPGDAVCAKVVKSSLRVPKDIHSPKVMVAIGTGLAPFMGFLEEHAMIVSSLCKNERESDPIPAIQLIYGCRRQDEILHYDKLQQWAKDGIINVHFALSRSPEKPMHVQDKIKDLQEVVSQYFFDDNGHYFICGSSNMADECYDAIVSIIRKQGNISRVAAVQHLNTMKRDNRYQYDLWGEVTHFEQPKPSPEQQSSSKVTSSEMLYEIRKRATSHKLNLRQSLHALSLSQHSS